MKHEERRELDRIGLDILTSHVALVCLCSSMEIESEEDLETIQQQAWRVMEIVERGLRRIDELKGITEDPSDYRELEELIDKIEDTRRILVALQAQLEEVKEEGSY